MGPPGRTRQLALLAVPVLAVHLAVLRPLPVRLAPQPEAPSMRFTTRSIAPPSAAAAPVPVAIPAPQPAAKATAPSPRRPSPTAAAATPAKPLPASLVAWPSAVLHYELQVRSRGVTVEGSARLDWQQDGGRYAARLELAAAGLRPRVQQSSGVLDARGLAPERFSDRSRGEQATHFEPGAGRVVFSNNQPDASWVTGMQDRLSVLLQLAMLAAAQPARFAPGTQVAIPTATTREADAWIFRVLGEEALALPGGMLAALKLERLPRREFDQKVELWLAPRLAYAPVRLRLTNPDGGWVDQRWSSTDRQ